MADVPEQFVAVLGGEVFEGVAEQGQVDLVRFDSCKLGFGSGVQEQSVGKAALDPRDDVSELFGPVLSVFQVIDFGLQLSQFLVVRFG